MHVSKDLFVPQVASLEDNERITRPILTYFQDAIIRFKKNKIALVCFWVLVFIFMVGLIGPFFFPSGYPNGWENYGDQGNINQSPTLGREVLVVGNMEAFEPSFKEGLEPVELDPSLPLVPFEEIFKFEDASIFPSLQNLRIEGQSTPDGVVLKWEALPQAFRYDIYRMDSTKASLEEDMASLKKNPLGVPTAVRLISIDEYSQESYRDMMNLKPGIYYVYAVVPVLEMGGKDVYPAEFSVVSTQTLSTIRLGEAQKMKADIQVGDVFKSRSFLFGTDGLGRDIFARMVEGTRVDFFLAFVVPTITLFLGLVYGAVAGLAGGWLDALMMRILEVLYMIPGLLVMILIQMILDKGPVSLIIAMSALGWVHYARICRGEVLRLREIEFVHASRLLGASTKRLIFKHISPNILGLLLVLWSSAVPGVIISEAFLSMMGLGLDAPAASWGMVLNDAGKSLTAYPAQFFLPCIVLAVTLLCFFMVGDGLSDAFDPKQRGRS